MRAMPCFFAAACTLMAQSAAVVEGRIVSAATGQPLKRAIVTLTGIPSSIQPVAESYACLSDADGRFTVKDVVPGAYQASASRTGYWNEKPGVARQLKALPGQRVAGIEIRLVPLGAISGRIVDENGAPVDRANLTVMRYQYTSGKPELRTMQNASTNDRGEYRIAVPSGRWYLRVSKAEYDPPLVGNLVTRGPTRERLFPALYYPGTADPLRAVRLDVAPGAELAHMDMFLRRESVHSLRVKVPPGSSPRIERSSPDMGSWVTRAGADGVFEISGLAPGTYTVMAVRNDRNPRRNMPLAIRRVQITNQDVNEIDLTGSTALEIAGKLTAVGEGAPAMDTMMLALKSDEPGLPGGYTFPIDADGSFTLTAHPGAYYLDINGPDGVYLKSVRMGERELPDHRFTAGRDTGKLTLVASLERGRVEGFVEDAQGSPAVPALVTLVPDQSLPNWIDLYKSEQTDTSGRFSFTAVVPGSYRLYAWVGIDPDPPMDPGFRKPFEARGAPVQVTANSSAAAKLVVIAPVGNR
jgi:hypothetical protein